MRKNQEYSKLGHGCGICGVLVQGFLFLPARYQWYITMLQLHADYCEQNSNINSDNSDAESTCWSWERIQQIVLEEPSVIAYFLIDISR